jgi:Polyketide cyclase / dehydrase and lipid transport
MAHYRASIDIQQPREDVFAYLSDFSTVREWDPGVVEAERLNGQAVGEGTEFRLVAEFLGRKNELTYRIVEYDPPHAVTSLAETPPWSRGTGSRSSRPRRAHASPTTPTSH